MLLRDAGSGYKVSLKEAEGHWSVSARVVISHFGFYSCGSWQKFPFGALCNGNLTKDIQDLLLAVKMDQHTILFFHIVRLSMCPPPINLMEEGG